MSTLSSLTVEAAEPIGVAALEYRDILFVESAEPDAADDGPAPDNGPPRLSLTEDELNSRIVAAVSAANGELERRLRAEYSQLLESERSRISETLESFQQERADYYAKVEPELVNLILAVAAKILHREAQVDRMLVAALAKIAVENLQQRSHVVLRVAPERCSAWREYFAAHLSGTKVEILEDSQLQPDGCQLETELGSADVGIDAQLKEIERGFFDLLAKRPETR